ncbi:MAG: methyltransferase type 11, partial [Candidatus Zixiibacteriota bacterium]
MISTTGDNQLLGLRNLPYPLNVYALVLDWDTGSVEHLHYGHFEHTTEPIEIAQNRAVELLCKQLPARGKVLEVGCGFGSLTHRLAQAGYDVTGISPDPAQIALARSRYGDELPVHCVRLEVFAISAGEWDLLLFHESAQYIAPLDLFECASRLLTPSGEILILDEFALKRTEPGPETLHLKKYFISLAERQGFACRTQLDCSQATTPTLDYLLRALDRHRDRILDVTGLSSVTIDTLIDANRCYREKYRSGRFGYCLLHLQRSNIPRWQLTRIKKADQPAVSSLFEEVFGHPLSPALWDWKYGSDGGQAVGLWQDGVLIAHYGGVPRCFERNGVDIRGIQNCDVMVKPVARSRFGRRGPFFLVAATFLEQSVGHGTSSQLAFGFPNERAFRLPFKLGLYSRPLTRVRQVEWPAQSRAALLLDTRPLNLEVAGDVEIVDMLWQRMVDDL